VVNSSVARSLTLLAVLFSTGPIFSFVQASSSDQGFTLNTEAVGPQHFIAAHGRRALIDGYATDGLEVWAYPFQIVSGYRVAFRMAGSTTAINGQDILSRVTYKPDSITRTYLGPGFIVREKLFVPLNQPGAILTYTIDSSHRVEIDIHATPVLNLMWPAGLGGQSVAWNSSLNAFVLKEPGHDYSAVVGSPDIVAHDEVGNRTVHGVGDAGLGFTLRPTNAGIAKVYVALNPPHATDPGGLFHTLIRDQKTLEAEGAAHFTDVTNTLLQVETPDARVNQAIAWSEIALDQAWVCNPDLGCGYVAGYGPSRDARRPQYDWFFAGDGLIATDAAVSMGDAEHARDELAFILHYQDSKTGMIWHELSQSAGLIDWMGKYPYMYVHVDITFQFLGTLARYVTTTGDTAFAREHWQAIEAAYRYCNAIIDPVSNLPRIPSDKEGGNEQDRMSDDLGLSTSWVVASAGFAQLATLTGHTSLATEAANASQRARTAIPGRYWSGQQSFWVSGHTQSGQPMLEKRSSPSEAITLGLFNREQSSHVLDQLASSAFQTNWGARGVGADSQTFDPESYSKGSVSALNTATLATTFWEQHRPVTAYAAWHSLLSWTSLDSLGHFHEVLAGNTYRPQIESVPEQTWSSAGFLNATIHGLLGLSLDTLAGHLAFAPRLPAEWNDVSISHIYISGATVSLALHRTLGGLTLNIDNSGNPFKFDFDPEIPLGASLGRAEFNHHPIEIKLDSYPQDASARAAFEVPHGKSELHMDVQGGISVINDLPSPLLGETSTDIHVITFQLDGNTLTIAADVPADRTSRVQIQTAWRVASADGVTMRPIAPDRVELTFAPGRDAVAGGTYRRAQATLQIMR
jgi:hypothetical protein